jgi:hypothetical protein
MYTASQNTEGCITRAGREHEVSAAVCRIRRDERRKDKHVRDTGKNMEDGRKKRLKVGNGKRNRRT